MGLTPIYKRDDDGWFNEPVARAAYEYIAKMDFDEARMLTTFVVVDDLWDTIAKNQTTLQRRVNTIVKKQSLAAAAVAKRNGDEELSKRFTELAKSTAHNPYYYGYTWQNDDHPRSRTGQFRTVVRPASDHHVNDRRAAQMGLPTSKTSGLSGTDLGHHQQEYAQIRDFLNSFTSSGLAGDTDFLFHIVDRKTGADRGVFRHQGTAMPTKAQYNPKTEKVVEVEARPSSITGPGAAFGLVSTLGGSDEAAQRAGAYGQGLSQGASPFYEGWNNAGAKDFEGGSNQRLYDRVGTGSAYLSTIGNVTGNQHLQMAGMFGQIVGAHGPQAEKVIGPGIRRTMYRYRGTEKTPDSDLTREYETAMRSPMNVDGSEAGTRAQRTATAFMISKIPSRELYDLNMKSGHTPPSEGIIINKDGKITTQAVGYGDDHYLPFNLKNLAGLKGGEYVRTRSVGGPTAEDVYTGMVSGAKRLTVVSRSGTFTVDFDDTFRGSRRYNDKAGRMVERYEKLVDAVKSRQVQRKDVEPSVKMQIASDVEDEMGDWTPIKEKRKEIKRRIDEYKAYPTVSAEDEAQIEAAVKRHSAGNDKQDNILRSQLRNQVVESKAFNYELNGTGYNAALHALQEQFPYYIASIHYSPRRDVGSFETELDRGYVKPNHNRPEGALEGFYDTSVQGAPAHTVETTDGGQTGKYTADTADYQNWGHNRQNLKRGSLVPKPATTDGAEGGEGAAKPKEAQEGSPKELAEDQIVRNKARTSLADAAWKIKSSLNLASDPEKQGDLAAIAGLDETEFKKWYEKPQNQKKFDAMLDSHIRPNLSNGILGANHGELLTGYTAAKGLLGDEQFDLTQHGGSVPSNPYSFKGREYLRGESSRGLKESKIKQISTKTPVPGHAPLADMTDDGDFRDALKTAVELRQLAHEASTSGNVAAYVSAAHSEGRAPSGADRYLKNPAEADQLVENVHRVWRLRRDLKSMPEKKGEIPKGRGLERTKEVTQEEKPAASTKADEYHAKADGILKITDNVLARMKGSGWDEQAKELHELRENFRSSLSSDVPDDAEIAGKAIYGYIGSDPEVRALWLEEQKNS